MRTREQAIEQVAAELARHAAPIFTDDDHKDTSSLNCRCGVRIPPKEGIAYRDWAAYQRHVAEAIVAVTGLAEIPVNTDCVLCHYGVGKFCACHTRCGSAYCMPSGEGRS